jgi:hypothetical protein
VNKLVNLLKEFSLKEVESMKVISQGHTDNLIYEEGNTRVWHSRMTTEDGMPYDNQITVEKYLGNNWVTVSEYEAK